MKIAKRVMTSIAIGAVTYVVTDVLIGVIGEPQVWAIDLSFLAGSVTLLTQFLHEIDERVSGIIRSQRNHEATELFSLVESSALRTEEVARLVRYSTRIKPSAPPIVFRFAEAELGRMSAFLKGLSEGDDVTYEGEDRDWVLALARNVESGIDATSLTTVDARGDGFVDGGLWSSDLGQRYIEVQRDALQRGVRIRRVFILDRPGLAGDSSLIDICQLQSDMGIEVRVLDSTGIPAARRGSLFDFILFDRAISYEMTPASNLDGSVRPAIVNTRLELRPARVRDRIGRFADLWDSAKEISDLPRGPGVSR